MNGALILFYRLFIIHFVNQLAKASSPTGVTFLTGEDFERGKAFNRDNGGVIDESSTRYSHLTDDDIIETTANSRRVERTAIKIKSRIWPGGEIPYSMDNFARAKRVRIVAAMQEIQDRTCIRFVKRTEEHKDFAHLRNHWQCGGQVGRVGKRQVVNIGGDCTQKGIVMHELLHTIGFVHEHMRPDRDKYVTIVKDNIVWGYGSHFASTNYTIIDNLGTPYDFGSIMHYTFKSFSKNGQPTIEPKVEVPRGVKVGQRDALSALDVLRVNLLYNCTDELCEKNLSKVDDQVQKWPRGLVPIESDSSFSSEARVQLAAAMAEIMGKVCIDFVTPDELRRLHPEIPQPPADYIQIRNSGGCGSHVGKKGGPQELFLGRAECQTKGSILHYLMHAIGFHHETARPDRDDYVEVVNENVHDVCKDNASASRTLHSSYVSARGAIIKDNTLTRRSVGASFIPK